MEAPGGPGAGSRRVRAHQLPCPLERCDNLSVDNEQPDRFVVRIKIAAIDAREAFFEPHHFIQVTAWFAGLIDDAQPARLC